MIASIAMRAHRRPRNPPKGDRVSHLQEVNATEESSADTHMIHEIKSARGLATISQRERAIVEASASIRTMRLPQSTRGRVMTSRRAHALAEMSAGIRTTCLCRRTISPIWAASNLTAIRDLESRHLTASSSNGHTMSRKNCATSRVHSRSVRSLQASYNKRSRLSTTWILGRRLSRRCLVKEDSLG
jgi:hypothetical protein